MKIAGFATALVVVGGAAALVGAAVDPVTPKSKPGHGEEPMEAHEAASAAVPGLSVASDGFRLVPDRTRYRRGEGQRFAFRIVDADGRPVDRFDVEHDKRMHLIVVRRDLTASSTCTRATPPTAPGRCR